MSSWESFGVSFKKQTNDNLQVSKKVPYSRVYF